MCGLIQRKTVNILIAGAGYAARDCRPETQAELLGGRRQNIEGVTGRPYSTDRTFNQQGIRSRQVQDRVGNAAPEIGRVEYFVALRINQGPGGIILIGRGHERLEIQGVAGIGSKLIKHGLVRRVQCTRDLCARHNRGCLRQIQQTKTETAGITVSS